MFKGASKPLLGNAIDAGHFHGYDGLGDAPDPKAPGLSLVQEEGAVSAMIRIINENPGEVRGVTLGCRRERHFPLFFKLKNAPQVSLVATAPLTNLALAVRIDPSLPSRLRGLYIMGGNTECQLGGDRLSLHPVCPLPLMFLSDQREGTPPCAASSTSRLIQKLHT